jgi:enoyl-CoA hydratase/carnithine racemase
MPENSIGFYPDVGVPFYLSRMKRNFGMFLALTGSRLKSYDCLHFGIGTHFISTSNLEKFIVKLNSVLIKSGRLRGE